MEAFLTTLPPYVHEFLDRYPPTDVFNLLKELICFAVLYSEDRDKLNQSTNDFLKKKQQENKNHEHLEKDDENEVESTEEELEEEEEATVPTAEKGIESIAEETEIEIQSLKAKPTYNIRTGELIQTEKSNMPNTFPEWWGHRESVPQKPELKETIIHDENNDNKALPQSFGSSWISWENQQPTSTPNTTNYRMERARSQIIPDLRSYLVEDSKLTTSRTAPSSNSSPSAAAANKKRYSLNTTSKTATVSPPTASSTAPPNTNKAMAKPKRRISSPPVCDSPVSTVPPASKFIQTATKQQQLRQNKTISPSSSGTSTPTRSASVVIKQPRQNAAMRARAEHARIQQEEMEKKKNAPAIGSSTSLRLKQRVNSGIDWESIKRDRRKTVAEAPSSASANVDTPKKD